MRKIFALILLALLVGVGVVAVIETEPGYVLISYGKYTLETSLWVGLLLLALVMLLLYWTVRLLRKLIGGQQSLVSWLGTRRVRQSSRLTTRGLISFIEGNWTRARRQLVRGAKNNETPLINYLMAARSSYRLNEPDKMREYLVAAEDSESEAGIAVELTEAELKLQAGEYEQALTTLVRARENSGRHPQVLELLHRAYRGQQDWQSLADLLPDLKKHKVLGTQELEQLQREVYVQLLQHGAAGEEPSADSLRGNWQKLPAQLQQDPELILSYVRLLLQQDAHAAAEKVILKSIKRHWDSRLARLYGYVQSDNLARQLTQAESWLPAHTEDAQLLLCLGRLSARDKLWGKARDYFESSYRLERSAETCAELGRLLTALGEPKVAGAYFREGLLLRETGLPELPMPDNLASPAQRLALS